MTDVMMVGAGLAIGLAGLWVSIGEGIIAMKSLQSIGKNPDMSNYFLVLTILGIALTESAAIYGLIVAFNIMGLDPAAIEPWRAVGAWLAVWLAWLWAGVGEGMLVSGAMEATLRNPEMKTKYMTFMILFLALVESAAIYGLIVAFRLLG
jgi:F0F1-type ATP synthase membrane subunit c/vacuolar-type H+-ATPase subunit K